MRQEEEQEEVLEEKLDEERKKKREDRNEDKERVEKGGVEEAEKKEEKPGRTKDVRKEILEANYPSDVILESEKIEGGIEQVNESISSPKKVKVEDFDFGIPEVKLKSPRIRKKKVDLNDVIPEIEIQRRRQIPIITTSSPSLRPKVTQFDDSEPKIERKRRKRPSVPFCNSRAFRIRTRFTKLDSKVRERIEEKVEEKAKEQEKIAGIKSSTGGGESNSGAEPPEFQDLVFNFRRGSIESKSEDPKVIFAIEKEEERYVGVLETLCKRIYRENIGGKPKAKSIKEVDRIGKKEVEKWMKAGNKIFSVNLKDNINPKKIRERLDEIYSQNLGYIIFEVNLENGNELEAIFSERSEMRHPIVPIIIRPKINLNNWNMKKKISEMVWGNIDLEEQIVRDNFDHIFGKARKRFFERLREIKESEDGLFQSATERHEEGEESEPHRLLKIFTVKYLVKTLRNQGEELRSKKKIKEEIKTEEDESYNNTIPDIAYGNTVYEIETLFGEGIDAQKKFEEKIKDYSNYFDEINFVIDNLTFLRHLDNIRRIIKHNKEEEIKINFHTLNLEEEKLVKFNKVRKQVKKIKEQIKSDNRITVEDVK